MKQGEKIRTCRPIRSRRTGLILPREGIFIGSTENIGRTLILVDFGAAGREYLFAHDIEADTEDRSQQIEFGE